VPSFSTGFSKQGVPSFSTGFYNNARRPHRGIELRAPEMVVVPAPVSSIPEIQRHEILGGLINEYSKAA
jgi:hypothetical protein